MKNLKKKVRFRINLKSKHLLAIMTIFCISCIVATFASGITTAPLQDAAGALIVPFENKSTVEELESEILGSMEVVYAKTIRDVLKVALVTEG